MNPVASDHGWDETHRMRRLEFRFELGAYVAGFRILLDDLGIETRSASCTRSRIVTFDARNKLLQYGAVGVVPVSVESTTSGALKGAAWGVFLAGPLGAAVGSMVGGGMKVAFELQTLEGEVLRCIAGKAAYLDIKKQVETHPAQPPKPKKARPEWTSPRKVGLVLGSGIAVLPIIFGLLLFRRGHTQRARAIAAVWAALWVIWINQLPEPPVEAAPPTMDPAGQPAPITPPADSPAADR